MKGWVYNEGIIKTPLRLFHKLFYEVRGTSAKYTYNSNYRKKLIHCKKL